MKRQRGFQTESLRRFLQRGLKRTRSSHQAAPHFEVAPSPGARREEAGPEASRDRLVETLGRWERLNAPLPEELIRRGLVGMNLDRRALGQAVRFAPEGCQRSRIHRSEHFEVIVRCWRSGQSTAIHDHGGSLCGMMVVEGTATRTVFERSPCGRLVPDRSHEVPHGTVGVTRAREVFLVANLQAAGEELICLSVYSPPLSGDRRYDLDETLFHDLAGEGSTWEATL